MRDGRGYELMTLGLYSRVSALPAFTLATVTNVAKLTPISSNPFRMHAVLRIHKVAQWRAQACATGGVKQFQLFYQVRLHLRPNEGDLAAVKLTYLQVGTPWLLLLLLHLVPT